MTDYIDRTEYFLVINLGLRSIRVIIFDQGGRVLDKNWYPVRTKIAGNNVEQNPEEWWKLTEILLDEVISKNVDYKKYLHAITVTSSACCLTVFSRTGKARLPSMMVSDKRAQQEADILVSDRRFSSLFKNNNFLPTASYMFPKICWIKKHYPKIFADKPFFANANDYLIYQLTGSLVTDRLNAEKFYYDGEIGYPDALLKHINLNSNQLPRVVEPGTVVGVLKKKLQKKLGLARDVKVIVSTYDAICAFVGSGTLSDGEVANVCGTVSSVRVMSKKPAPYAQTILSQRFDNFYIVGGSNNIDGGLLEWSKTIFYGDGYPDQYIYKIMEEEATTSPVGSRGIIFCPYLLGERMPFFDTECRGLFFGLERYHRRNDIVRSIYEASGFMIYNILQSIESHNVHTNIIKMSGGLSQNNIACKIRADITGKKVDVLSEIETTSQGALFIMLFALGYYSSYQDLARLVKIKKTYIPHKKNHIIYKKIFMFFKKVYNTNKNLMAERNQMLHKIMKQETYSLNNL